MTRRTRLAARLSIAALMTITGTVGVSTLSSAAPSKREVDAAQARIDQLNQHMSLLVEQYDQEQTRLQAIQSRLSDARATAQRAQATADRALQKLNDRAASVYTRVGSEIEVLLGADSFAEFSDRLEYVGSLAQADSDLATQAEHAQQQAQWAGQQLHDALQEQQKALDTLRAKETEIRSAIADAKAEFETINRRYHDYLDAQAAAEAAQQASGTTFTVSPPPGGPPPSTPRTRSSARRTCGGPPIPASGSTARASRCGRGRTPASRSRTPPRCSTSRCRTSARATRSPVTSSSSTRRSATSGCTSAAAG
jgi:peptidoglycan hydrolase CwlO-like protein